MITIKKAWYVNQLPTHIVAELETGDLVMFMVAPFRKIKSDEMLPYKGHHPDKCTSYPVPNYVLRHYGLMAHEGAGIVINGLSIADAEREYGFPEGTIRRDIHRGKFGTNEVEKVGSNWFITREAVKRVYLGGEKLATSEGEVN